MLIAFMSDFGIEDEYVGVCKLVIKEINPLVSIIDITHTVYPFDVLTGAWMLYNITEHLPPNTVVLPIVDPGVGSERKGIIVETERNITFVGPDNGIIHPSADKLGITGVWEVIPKEEQVSPTFHGRDIFAPTAARLSRGMSPNELNTKPLKTMIKEINIFGMQTREGKSIGEVMHIDHFGTIRTNIPFSWLRNTNITENGEPIKVKTDASEFNLRYHKTFTEATAGETFILPDSFGWISIARNRGRADKRLKLRPHDTIIIEIS